MMEWTLLVCFACPVYMCNKSLLDKGQIEPPWLVVKEFIQVTVCDQDRNVCVCSYIQCTYIHV